MTLPNWIGPSLLTSRTEEIIGPFFRIWSTEKGWRKQPHFHNVSTSILPQHRNNSKKRRRRN